MTDNVYYILRYAHLFRRHEAKRKKHKQVIFCADVIQVDFQSRKRA